MRDDTYLQIEPNEFESFKKELLSRNKKGAYHMVALQKFSYDTAKALLKNGTTVEGIPLTDEERGYLKKVIEEIRNNLDELKEEYEL